MGTLTNLIWFLLVGLAAGWLGAMIMKRRGMGLIGNLIVGIIGALLGGWLFGLFGLTSYTLIGSLITAVCGSIVLLYLLRLIQR